MRNNRRASKFTNQDGNTSPNGSNTLHKRRIAVSSIVIFAMMALLVSLILFGRQPIVLQSFEGIGNLSDTMVVTVADPTISQYLGSDNITCQPTLDTLDELEAFHIKLETAMDHIKQNEGGGLSIPAVCLYFEIGDYHLDVASQMLLSAFADSYCITNKMGKVEVSGFTCDFGTETYNLFLAQQRNNEVAKYLIKQGIPRQNINMKPYGESRNHEFQFDEEYLYRRVIVSILSE